MICAAYVVRAGEEASPADLRDHLKKLIPNYMMPARFTAYEALPKNANGKIDRPRLKDAFIRNETSGQPEVVSEAR
jgi:acyl-coenzyme A synthetase/AMP-(fatty) acid ligase